MNYTAEIVIDDTDVYDILKPEIRSHDRAEEKISKEKNGTKITVISKDSTALRASLNMITKLCTTYEKIKELK
jgi:tRNA threonylcarbamoyladenosine modification (KEOPS) complex  Pcc1 subunit